MVQIAKAWAVDRKTGEGKEIAARHVDKAAVKDYDWFCPDECCRAPLTHYNQHLQTFQDPESGERFKINVAAHFQRKKGGAAHAEACKAVDDYTKYQLYARAAGGISHQHGSFVFNINIPTDTLDAPIRKKPSALTQKFQQKALDRAVAESATLAPKIYEPRSMGLRDVEKLGGLLDVSAFDPEYRRSIILRDGRRLVTLDKIFKDDPISFYREEHERAKKNSPEEPVLVHFKPIAIGKYHSRQSRTIQGIAAPITASNGRARYSVSVMLHCGNEKIFDDIVNDIKDGNRSFLIYAPRAQVNLIELAHKKKEMEIGKPKDNAVFVHIRADRAEQVAAWTPLDPQLCLALPMPDGTKHDFRYTIK